MFCLQKMLRQTGVGEGVVLRCSQPCDEREPHLHPADRAGDERVSKRWYILVIVLLYIGLIISFCLNLALLLRKHPPVHQLTTFSTANVEGQLLTLKYSVRGRKKLFSLVQNLKLITLTSSLVKRVLVCLSGSKGKMPVYSFAGPEFLCL